MKLRELRQLDKKELEKRLEELRKELMKYNAQISTSTPPENPGNVRKIKRTIAKIITISKEKQNMEVVTKSNEWNMP